jgi:hypothetical protein
MKRSAWWLLAGLALLLAGVLVAGFEGWLGPLVTCGVDRAAVCVAWPGAVSLTVWLIFIGTLGALAVWQARDWRNTSIARHEWLWLLILLGAALVERTWRIDLAQVAYDETSAASLVAGWRLQGLFPLTGIISSVGVPNPPGWPYLLALVLLVFDSPYALVGLGIASGLLAVLLTWWVARRWIGPWAALAAAAFYAGGFWASFLGRGGWQPAFLQAPVILCLDALLMLAVRRWPWALVLAAGWLALMIQLHYIAVLFVMLVPLAAWPARRVLRPVHVVSAALVGTLLLAPFVVYELNPTIRLRDLGLLLGDAGGGGAHWDLESWNLLWMIASNGGAASLGGPDAEGLRQSLGRWTLIGLLGIPLVAIGALVAVAGWPRGWRGWLIAGWLAMPVLGLAHHTLGVLFHYLYLGLPGMALAVGALAEWSAHRRLAILRLGVGGALASYVAVSVATLAVVLAHVDRTGLYPGLGKPLGLNMAAAEAARAALPAGGQVLIGGYNYEVEVLRFSLGYSVPSRLFDDCADIPTASGAIYLLNSEHTPAAKALSEAGAPLLARVPRPGDAFLILGPPTTSSVNNGSADTPVCRNRFG